MPHGAANGVAGFPAQALHAKGSSKIHAQGSLTSRGCSRNIFPECRAPPRGGGIRACFGTFPGYVGFLIGNCYIYGKGMFPGRREFPVLPRLPRSHGEYVPRTMMHAASPPPAFSPDTGDSLISLVICPTVSRTFPGYTLLSVSYAEAASVPSPIRALFCVGAFGVQILAMGAILQTATGISLIPAALIASIVTLAYTWSGGILAVTLTDAVQYVIIVIGVTLCGYLAIDHLGGFDAMMSILYSNPRFESNMKPMANWSLVQFLGLFFSFLLGEFCAPYYIQRYASTKSAKDSKNGLLIFGVHWIFFMATTAAIGLASMAIQPDVKPDLAFTNLIRDILPPGITGLVFGALLAAVMSTSAAMINTAAVIYTRDIYNKFINAAATQADLLRQSRLSTLLVGGISIGVAIVFQDVFGLMIYLFKLWPSAILPPLMCGLLWGKISPYAGAPAVIAGGLSFFLWSDKVLGEPFGIPANFIGIGMNCLVLFFIHQKMKNHKPEGPFLPDLN